MPQQATRETAALEDIVYAMIGICLIGIFLSLSFFESELLAVLSAVSAGALDYGRRRALG